MSNTGWLIVSLIIMTGIISATVFFVRKGLRADKLSRQVPEIAMPPAVEDKIIDPAQILAEADEAVAKIEAGAVPELDEHGVPVVARPVRRWLVYLLTGICLASGIGQMWWTVSIAATQMVGIYTRWKTEHILPESPVIIAFFGSAGVGLWTASKGDQFSKTERRVLYAALTLAAALGAIGYLILTLKEPYSNNGGAAG
jgi:hypothetical protein